MTSLSNSELFAKMQEYYRNIGPAAWEDELVPSQITSNRLIAERYADLIIAILQDYSANNKQLETFHIIEIGAGHGKLSFYLLKILARKFEIFGYPLSLLKYVVTDISYKNIESWQKHPTFKDWIENEIVDFAHFNAMECDSIELINSKQVIKKDSLNTPVIMICNYLFDTLSHDAFQIREQKLYETTIAIESDNDWQDYFEKAKFEFKHKEVSPSNYYKNAALNKVLEDYTKEEPVLSFTMPVGGFSCIDKVASFSTENLYLLTADKAISNLDLVRDLDDPDIQVHGSVSLVVNFDAIRRYMLNQGGLAFLMPNTYQEFQVGCFVLKNRYKNSHLTNVFDSSFMGLCPQDGINLCYLSEDVREDFSNLDELLALLNLSYWDPNIFYDFHESLIDFIEDEEEELNLEQEKIILHNLPLVHEYFFKLEKDYDVYFALAGAYYALDQFEKAIFFYQRSNEVFGENIENIYNLALTYKMLEDKDTAKKYIRRSLELDPNYEPIQELIEELA